jgi:hypothetical protein
MDLKGAHEGVNFQRGGPYMRAAQRKTGCGTGGYAKSKGG